MQPYNSNTYKLVLSKIQSELQETSDGFTTFAQDIHSNMAPSLTAPSITVIPFGSSTTLIYDIEMHVDATTITKWTKHASMSNILILVVPKEAMEYTATVCTPAFTNYEIIGWSVVPGEKKKSEISIQLHR